MKRRSPPTVPPRSRGRCESNNVALAFRAEYFGRIMAEPHDDPSHIMPNATSPWPGVALQQRRSLDVGETVRSTYWPRADVFVVLGLKC